MNEMLVEAKPRTFFIGDHYRAMSKGPYRAGAPAIRVTSACPIEQAWRDVGPERLLRKSNAGSGQSRRKATCAIS
jgi:hypothetical protein